MSIQPRLNGGTGRAEFVADLVSGLALDHPQNDVGTLDLSDSKAEDSIYDGESMRRFVGVKLGVDRVPEETTILRFRQLLGSTSIR